MSSVGSDVTKLPLAEQGPDSSNSFGCVDMSYAQLFYNTIVHHAYVTYVYESMSRIEPQERATALVTVNGPSLGRDDRS